jgi:hypothetical protein
LSFKNKEFKPKSLQGQPKPRPEKLLKKTSSPYFTGKTHSKIQNQNQNISREDYQDPIHHYSEEFSSNCYFDEEEVA